MTTHPRPLSPHLQVYKPQITSILSIFHRMSGVFLVMGLVLFAIWLGAAAYGPESFDMIQSLLGSWIGRLALFGWSVALFYHMCNGLRHLAWDFGYGFSNEQVAKSGLAVLGATAVLTLAAWAAALVL